MQRKPYDQGWLDGSEAATREWTAGAERRDRIAEACAKLQSALDQSARVRLLEGLLIKWAEGWSTEDGHPSDLYHATLAALNPGYVRNG